MTSNIIQLNIKILRINGVRFILKIRLKEKEEV